MAASAPADAGMPRRPFPHLLARTLTAVVLGAAALAADWAGGWAYLLFLLVLLAGLVREWAGLMRAANAAAVVRLAGWLVWFGPAIAAALWLREAHGALELAWCLAVVWASDIGAYFVGRTLRGPKLAPRISPGKTWSGLAGGLAAAVVVGAGWTGAFAAAPSALRLGLAALAVAAAGAVGDLAESALKRYAGVKDSGHILPGHGGLFDRLDSVLFALPVAALLIGMMERPA